MIFIFDENQTVTVKWNGGNIPRLKALGYEFTGRGEDVEILAKHLTDHSGVIVNATCDYCGKTYKSSVGEALVEDVLNQMCIPYKREYKFDDCVDKRPLLFDFYLHTLNKIIEFDGPQHFKEVGMLNHEVTVYHDKIKNEFCERNNIPILRIPYWERDNINVLINDFLN